MRAAHPLAVA